MDKFVGVVQDTSGNLVTTGTISVYTYGTTTPVTIYDQDDTGVGKANPFNVPASGKIEFFARNGRLRIVHSSGAEVDDVTMSAGTTFGTFSARPAAGSADRLYFATDLGRVYRDTGSAWEDYPDYAKDALDLSAGVDVIATAGTTDVFGGAGNYIEVTNAAGSPAITALANNNAPEGSIRFIRFSISAGSPSLTYNATSLEIAGAANWSPNNGDCAIVQGKGGSNVRLFPLRIDGSPIALGALAALQADQEAASSLLKAVTPGVQQFHPSAIKFFVKFNLSGVIQGTAYNVPSVADNGTGDWTPAIGTDFSGADWVCGGNAHLSATDCVAVHVRSQAAGTVQVIATRGSTNALYETNVSSIQVHGMGDQ